MLQVTDIRTTFLRFHFHLPVHLDDEFRIIKEFNIRRHPPHQIGKGSTRRSSPSLLRRGPGKCKSRANPQVLWAKSSSWKLQFNCKLKVAKQLIDHASQLHVIGHAVAMYLHPLEARPSADVESVKPQTCGISFAPEGVLWQHTRRVELERSRKHSKGFESRPSPY